MAERRYIDGNTVRKWNVETYPEKRYEQEVRPSRRRTVRHERGLTLNASYVSFLAAATIFCLAMCISYINVQSQISETKTRISSLESEVSLLVSQNDALDYEINSYTDLNHVYKVATKEMGMVEASGSQVELYEKSDSEYTNQMGDIPTE